MSCSRLCRCQITLAPGSDRTSHRPRRWSSSEVARFVATDLIELRGAFSGYVWEVAVIERDSDGRPEARKRTIEHLGVIEGKAKAIEQRAREHLTP
jgi:hypothetical protein